MTPSTLRVATAANPPGTARATPREYEFRSTSAVAAHEQRNRRSSGKVLNLRIVLDWFSGAISPMAKCWTTKQRSGRGVADGSPSDVIDRDVGEPDAMRRHHDTERNHAATRTRLSYRAVADSGCARPVVLDGRRLQVGRSAGNGQSVRRGRPWPMV